MAKQQLIISDELLNHTRRFKEKYLDMNNIEIGNQLIIIQKLLIKCGSKGALRDIEKFIGQNIITHVTVDKRMKIANAPEIIKNAVKNGYLDEGRALKMISEGKISESDVNGNIAEFKKSMSERPAKRLETMKNNEMSI